MKPDSNWMKRREKKRVCPKCGAVPKFLGIDGSFKVHLECPKCGHEFTGADGKVVSE